MCKIKINKIIHDKPEILNGSGFFLKLNDNEIPFHNCLITNNHIINEKYIQMKKEITLICKNIHKSFILSGQRRIFTNKNLDYTCLEILEEEFIK